MAITPEDIDKLAEKERWFAPTFDKPPFTLILRHLDGNLSLQNTVTQLTDPINASFTSANSGNAVRRAEGDAAHQRQFHTEESFREQWGDPLPESEVPPEVADAPSTEGQLWELWYAVLHAAKRSHWREQRDVHMKLLDLVRAITNTPNPPAPAKLTKALQNDWIWEDEKLWSNQRLLGPSSREMWNDSPGCGAGYSDVSTAAWRNVNAFVARMTADGVREYWMYAIWAMRDGLEESDEVQKLDANVPAAAVWVFILGRRLYEREEDLTEDDPHRGDPGRVGDLMRQRTENVKSEFSKARWAFWKMRFQEVSVRNEVKEVTKDIAKEAVETMDDIERA